MLELHMSTHSCLNVALRYHFPEAKAMWRQFKVAVQLSAEVIHSKIGGRGSESRIFQQSLPMQICEVWVLRVPLSTRDEVLTVGSIQLDS